MKTKLEIINETVAYYSEDVSRRSLDVNHCLYLNDKGNTCAFSRCCIDPSSLSPHEGEPAHQVLSAIGYDCLKPAYRIEDPAFWTQIQCLHDYHENCSENGLTESGKEFVKNLIEKYS